MKENSNIRIYDKNIILNLPRNTKYADNILNSAKTQSRILDEAIIETLQKLANNYIESTNDKFNCEIDAKEITKQELKAFIG